MVRLVFRPYTHIRRSICTSESLRASTRVSPGFTLCRHSSPSFGSHPTCSASPASVNFSGGRRCLRKDSRLSLSLCPWVFHPKTRTQDRLLGPCFKTGRLKPFRQQRHHEGVPLDPSRPRHTTASYNAAGAATFMLPFSNGQNGRWPVNQEMHPAGAGLNPRGRD